MMRISLLKTLSAMTVSLAVIFAVSANSFAAGRDEAAIKALYAKAKAEGEVILWGPQKLTIAWVAEAFPKDFPGIKVKWVPDLRSATKIITEAKAGKHNIDVFHWTIGAGIFALNDRNLLDDTPFGIFGTAKDKLYLGGKAGPTHNYIYALIYNEEKIKESELPDKWEDFLKPKWKGKLLASPFLMPWVPTYLAMAPGWGEERAMKFVRGLIHNQDVMLTRAPRDSVLAGGERIISLTDFPTIARLYRKNGVPVAFKLMDVIPVIQFSVATVKNAPHPNAAKLLAAWMTSASAKAARERLTGAADLAPESQSKLAVAIRNSGSKIVYDTVELVRKRMKLHKKFAPIVVGRKR